MQKWLCGTWEFLRAGAGRWLLRHQTGMAQVESRKRCPEGWKLCSSPGLGALPVQNWEPRQGRRGKGCSENRKNLLAPARDSHYSRRFKTGQVRFGSKTEMAKLPEDCFQPSLEQVQAPTACLLRHHPCALLTHCKGKVSPAFVSF